MFPAPASVKKIRVRGEIHRGSRCEGKIEVSWRDGSLGGLETCIRGDDPLHHLPIPYVLLRVFWIFSRAQIPIMETDLEVPVSTENGLPDEAIPWF